MPHYTAEQVQSHFAWRDCAFIRDRSEIRYFLDVADDKTIEACKSLAETNPRQVIPEPGQVCVVFDKVGTKQFNRQVWMSPTEALTLAHREGWWVPPPPEDAGIPGFWNGIGEWMDTVAYLTEEEASAELDELPPEI